MNIVSAESDYIGNLQNDQRSWVRESAPAILYCLNHKKNDGTLVSSDLTNVPSIGGI
jgi:hypothetical protein